MPTLDSVHPVLMVRDVSVALRFYAALGFRELFRDRADDPMYAGVARDAVELHLQWHDGNEWGYPVDRPTYRFVVQDVDGLHDELSARAEVTDFTTPGATDWGTYEFHVRDPDGNGLQFYRDQARGTRDDRAGGR
jgi:catechol 2,3-dioxygenase-like lactoylglutathione lyase family enzyme